MLWFWEHVSVRFGSTMIQEFLNIWRLHPGKYRTSPRSPSRSWCGRDTSNPSQLCHGTLWASQANGGMRIHPGRICWFFFGCHWHPEWGKDSDFVLSNIYIYPISTYYFVFFRNCSRMIIILVSVLWSAKFYGLILLPGSGRKPSPCCQMWLRCMALKVMLIDNMELEHETFFLSPRRGNSYFKRTPFIFVCSI